MSRATDIISLEEYGRIARENGLNPDLFVDPSWDSSNTLAFAEHVAELAAQRGYDEGRRVQNGDKLTADEYMRLLEWSRAGKPASTAFTSGLLRDIAYLLEHVMSEQALAGRKPQDENKVAVLYDLSPLAAESVVRGKLIEMGWTPPKAEQQEPVRQHRTVTYVCPVCAASMIESDEAMLRQALEGIELHLRHHERGCVFLDEIALALRERLASGHECASAIRAMKAQHGGAE